MAKARLGSVVSSLSGDVGGLVVLDGRGGVAVRARPTYRRATSPAQAAVEARMRAASAAWSGLSAEGAAQWRAYGARRGRTAQTAFVALATKLLQIDPAASVPLLPPARDFVPDDVAVAASGSPAGVLFAATGPNRPGTVVELLLQALPNERRSPTKRYGSAGFTQFASGSLTHLLPLAPGSYAVGYRMVAKATGEQGPTILLGVVRVG